MDTKRAGMINTKFYRTQSIKCVVNGKKLTFRIVGFTRDPILVGFGVRFSDGVEFEARSNPMKLFEYLTDDADNFPDVQTPIEEGGDFVADNPEHKPYVKAITEHLNTFVLVMNSQWYQLVIKYKKEDLVVWVGYRDYNDFPYSVCFNGDYQFSLKRDDGVWKSKTVRVMDTRTIDPEMYEKIIKALEAKIPE
ncbi:MAG: hypothetical protein ABJA90_10630 [Ginsengibacter sp.]